MSHQDYQAPRLRNIIVAPLTFLAVLALLFMLSSVVKRVGDVLLYVPSKLGIVQRVAPAEVQEIDLRMPSPALLEFTKLGKYSVFTGDTMLLAANALYGADAAVWLVVKSQTTGEQIKIVPVERGLRPYDTPLADGRPIFAFEIVAPGAIPCRHGSCGPPTTFGSSRVESQRGPALRPFRKRAICQATGEILRKIDVLVVHNVLAAAHDWFHAALHGNALHGRESTRTAR